MGVGAAELAGAVLSIALLGVEFGWLALAVGAATGRRGYAIAVASAAAVAAYVLFVAGQLVDAVEPWQAAVAVRPGPGRWPARCRPAADVRLDATGRRGRRRCRPAGLRPP